MSYASVSKIIGSLELREAIQELLDEATAKQQFERRTEVHYPFFCPATLTLHGAEQQRFSVFTREISLSGVGLLHSMPLERSEVLLTMHRDNGRTTNLRTKIVWCRPCGEGWYFSGGRFINAVTAEND